MAAYVSAFNNLPRPRTTPSGLPNHWYFAVRHVPFNPPGDMLQIVHTKSYFIFCEGPKQILSLPTDIARAELIAELLLKSFVEGISRGSDGQPLAETPPIAPWSWGTRDTEIAKLVEQRLKSLGVRSDICTVHQGSKEEDDAADASWDGFIKTLMKTTGNELEPPRPGKVACDGCMKDSTWFLTPMKRCANCRSVRYCSQNCQKDHWKKHKKVCSSIAQSSTDHPASTPAANSKLDPFEYYTTVAHTVPEAKALAESMGLTLDGGIRKPLRRLVLTGNDTPENIQLLLGPRWSSEQAAYDEVRLDVLLNPPPGSPSYCITSMAKLDEGSPKPSPRPATAEETQKIQAVRYIQAAVARQKGSRKQATSQDMQAVLTAFGPKWPDMVPLYQLAVNTMDQGSPVG